MNSKLAAGALTALIYFQGLLGFAGLATVLIKDRFHEAETAHHATLPDTQTAAL